MLALQIGQRAAQCVGLIGPDPFDEMNERGMPVTGVGGLGQRIDHETGNQFVPAMGRRVAVGTVVADAMVTFWGTRTPAVDPACHSTPPAVPPA